MSSETSSSVSPSCLFILLDCPNGQWPRFSTECTTMSENFVFPLLLVGVPSRISVESSSDSVDLDPNNKHPSFSNLLEQGFIDKIRMPAAFVKEHKKMLAKTALLKTDEGLYWEAKIVKVASDYFVCEGDWPRFVLHHKLNVGDMLIFFLLDKSTFQVLHYSKKPLANIRQFEELSSSEDEIENVEENNEASRKLKKVKMEAVQLSGNRVDPPGGSKDGGNPCYSNLGKSDAKAPETNKVNEVKMEPVILSDSEEERVDPSRGSKDGGNPCYSHPGGKSHAKDDNMLGLTKKTPETKEAKRVFMELIVLSDSEEENVHPPRGSKNWGNLCYLHPGGKSDAKADNMHGVKKKVVETKKAKKAAKDPDKAKSPASAFYVKRGWRSDRNPNKPKKPAGAFFIFMEDFRKQFKEENPNNKSKVPIHRAGGEKWKQLSDAEKAPYMAETRKWLADYHKKKDAYKKRVAAEDSDEEESYKSLFEVD
ncbi:hypothetical protein H5410_006655 [Solanum commersonii]|uniref:Uncharacterized protein n=1 Tax=Solanum commersonii TaxID=4109 RepID=A0A9J6A9Y6_SOLCO|nr:hypothetical protein H5410_006655 [Solanum commersonii]